MLPLSLQWHWPLKHAQYLIVNIHFMANNKLHSYQSKGENVKQQENIYAMLRKSKPQ